ncbi:hypothetical protein F5I97DRAFT_1826715 [Phlebopus sp. FC_14]|nr:hypothetical protein F5I97DRAFT_1826715 [Phlebopus sp. FC_14]
MITQQNLRLIRWSCDIYFKRHWGKVLHAEVLKNIEQTFKEHYIQIYEKDDSSLSPKKKKSKLSKLLWQLSNDEDEVIDEEDLVDPKSSWMREFNLYLHSTISPPDGMSVIQWWED